MKLIFLILFALLIAAAFAGVIYLCVKTLEQKSKIVLIAFAAISLIVSEVLLFSTPSLPQKANGVITLQLANAENRLNSMQAGLTTQVLDPTALQQTLSDSQKLLSKANTDTPAGWIVRIIGARKYTQLMETAVSNSTEYIHHFEATNTPLTLHNIFSYTQEQIQASISKAVRGLQIAILILALVLLVVCVICYFAIRHDALSDPQIIMGQTDPSVL